MSAPLHAEGRTPQNLSPQATTWRRRVDNPCYAHLPDLRAEMARFMADTGIPAETAERYSLSLCEIISNLVKHPPRKAREVEILLSADAGRLRLDVADDSTPFASFDAFCKTAPARLQAMQSMAESGYGLGCILAQHTRVFYISAAQSPDARNHFVIEDTAATDAAVTHAPPHEKPLVFLVDDDPSDLKAHHRMLSGSYDVVPLPDAASAIALFHTRRPDLIISDLHMPDINGAALRRKISALPDGDLVPFVFLSAAAESINDMNLLRLGIDDYIVKPATAQALQRVAARILGRQNQIQRAVESRFHRDVQKYLHPHLPPAAGPWHIALQNRMADTGGGDFTLHHETGDGMTVFLADVMGHGTEAKFFTYAYAGYLHSLFRMAMVSRAPLQPCDFLRRLSDAVADDEFLDGTMLTCQSFHLGAMGTISIASAGHPPPLLLPHAGRPHVLAAGGPLPGLHTDIGYTQQQLALGAGDKVIFATDGFFDAFAVDGEAYPPAALLQSLQSLGPMDAETCKDVLWQAFEARRDNATHTPDDATLIIAMYGGSDECA